ncbi:hypothetical protein PMAYCL1PPCAC_06401, partial [Pristionchus mayeri]
VVFFNPGWLDFSLVTLRCSLVGNLLALFAIAALVKKKKGVEKRKVDILPLLLLSLFIDLIHSAFVLWYYNSIPDRVEFDDYDRPTNLVYSSLTGCTLVLNYLGQLWKLVAALEVAIALHRFLSIVCRVTFPLWTIFVLAASIAIAMMGSLIWMHLFGEVFHSRFWCNYRFSEEKGKEVLDFLHSLSLIGATIFHTTTLVFQLAQTTPRSSSIGVSLALLIVLPHATIDALVWQFDLHQYSHFIKFLPDNYHFHLAEYRLLFLSLSSILFVYEIRSSLFSLPLTLISTAKTRLVHVKTPKESAVDV